MNALWEKIKQVFQHLLTEKDNITFCPVRMLFMFSGASYHAGFFSGILMHQIVLSMATLGDYTQHLSILLGAGAASVGAKSLLKADAPS